MVTCVVTAKDLAILAMLILFLSEHQEPLDDGERAANMLRECYESIESRDVQRLLDKANAESYRQALLMEVVQTLHSVQNIDDLQRHLEQSHNLVDEEDVIQPFSPIGTYARSLSLAVKRMTFDQLSSLLLDVFALSAFFEARVSLVDEELCLKIVMTQPEVSHETATDTVLFKSKILGERVMATSDSNYQIFRKAWLRGDLVSAIEQLHKHFDYHRNEAQGSSTQYALLNLALLQADAGHRKEALWALCEAIDAARENRDQECLESTLSWFHALSEDSLEPSAIADEFDSTTSSRMAENKREIAPDVAPRFKVQASMTHDDRWLHAARKWSELDFDQLSRLQMRLGSSMNEKQRHDRSDIRLDCMIVRELWSLEKKEEAQALLRKLRTMTSKSKDAQIVCDTLSAEFALREGQSRPELEGLELQEIQRDPTSVRPRIQRLIGAQRLQEADALLRQYLTPKPDIRASRGKKDDKREVLYHLLSSCILSASSTPSDAITPCIRALNLARKSNLRRLYREAMEHIKHIAELLR